jgi:hypothetical protein
VSGFRAVLVPPGLRPMLVPPGLRPVLVPPGLRAVLVPPGLRAVLVPPGLRAVLVPWAPFEDNGIEGLLRGTRIPPGECVVGVELGPVNDLPLKPPASLPEFACGVSSESQLVNGTEPSFTINKPAIAAIAVSTPATPASMPGSDAKNDLVDRFGSSPTGVESSGGSVGTGAFVDTTSSGTLTSAL